MRVGNFGLQVLGGQEVDSGHVRIPHGTQYQIQLSNYEHGRRCDATVTVDGKEIGAFRLNAHETITLERGTEETGKFTFFETGSAEEKAAGGADVKTDDRGLLQVVYRPEKAYRPAPPKYSTTTRGPGGQSVGGWSADTGGAGETLLRCIPQNSVQPQGLHEFGETTKSGITGLTGHSNQKFHEVPNLDYADGEDVTISLRLVAGAAVRPLKAVKPRSNPVPKPV